MLKQHSGEKSCQPELNLVHSCRTDTFEMEKNSFRQLSILENWTIQLLNIRHGKNVFKLAKKLSLKQLSACG